jgi:hypothetical protein
MIKSKRQNGPIADSMVHLRVSASRSGGWRDGGNAEERGIRSHRNADGV